MFKSRYEWAIVTLLVALLGAAWIVTSRDPVDASPSAALTEAPIVGHLAPRFSAATPDGVNYVLDDLAGSGQPVVLNFWASWCGPCRVEMPHLQSVSEAYAGQAAIWGVNQAESPETIQDFQNETQVTYPLLADQDWTVNRLYGVANLPTTVFVDAQGIVREVFVGTMSRAVLESKVQALLEG